ncbi:ABC transporter substrate-binding protein [Corynebacterium provencense]|jgi:sulfonate transport system substrate-binding protein|uniref:ABC transporter substrate-binding protein n=1 Tax=Corynebacterium provencense TaxID=1737425 RepID=UPI00082D4E19|nr:ABC transporter substrate-binding protein [Corynebacterium provencense]
MKKLLSLLAAVVLGAAGTTACSSGSEPFTGDLSGTTLKVGDQVAGTEKVLQAAGELDDVPYTIEWSSFTSGPPQIEALNAGQIDFAVTGNTPPVLGGDTSTKVVQAYGNDAVGDAVLVRDDSGISTVEQLKGRKIAVARGSSAHGHLVLQLEKAGLSVDDVEINYLQPADSKSAFEAGQVDAWAVWDPYTAIAELSGAKALVRATGVANGYGFGITSDSALGDEARTAALRDLVQRVARAYIWADEHPDEWAAIYAEETGTELEAAKLNTRSTRLAIPLDDKVNESQNSLIDAFVTAGVLPEGFDFGDKVDTRFTDDVRQYFR